MIRSEREQNGGRFMEIYHYYYKRRFDGCCRVETLQQKTLIVGGNSYIYDDYHTLAAAARAWRAGAAVGLIERRRIDIIV